jgi:N-methylhydantoinase A
MPALFRAAVDIGGTFSDIQVLELATGRTYAHKTPTTPDDPSEGLIRGLCEIAERVGFSLDCIEQLLHGTTIATNAVIMRRLPLGALVTTAGFEDVLEIGRHERRDIYANRAEARTLLVPRDRRFGVAERTRANGDIEMALADAEIDRLAGALQAAAVDCVAVCLLHAYANPAHERQLEEGLTCQLPGLAISASHQVSPEIREFERCSTTVLNALLAPVVQRYLENLRNRMTRAGIDCPVLLVQSNGGVTSLETAARFPVRLLLSGPSGGALAAETIAKQTGCPNLIAVDMGGTSYDVSVVHDGQVKLVNQGDVAGCPVRLPMVEIRTIGAGGGSLARIDAVGRLAVGPQSAGSWPGPACYGHGGDFPAVTDANVALGRIDPDYFLGGAIKLDVGAARHAIQRHVAAPAGLAMEQAAEGVLQVVTAQMATAIRLSLFEKGLDPADFTLVSFGGAGGLHACATAAELGASRVLFPRDPGTLSAWGMLYSNIVHDLARSRLMTADWTSVPALARIVADLEKEANALLAADGIEPAHRAMPLMLDLRYPGQAYEIPTPLDNADGLPAAVADFHRRHQAQFAHAEPDVTPQFVTVRLAATGRLPKPRNAAIAAIVGGGDATVKGSRQVYTDGGWRDLPIHERCRIAAGHVLTGPLIVEEPHATLYLPVGWTLRLLEQGELLAEQSE